MPTFDRFPLLGLRLEELREELERSFLSTNSPPLGLSSWSRNLLARARAGYECLREGCYMLLALCLHEDQNAESLPTFETWRNSPKSVPRRLTHPFYKGLASPNSAHEYTSTSI
ncbi:hypothetical protein Taro_047605 [Colocasia esculenta]|uniref:Uncharacterized protein n=1 Tax=Colocasia esculenta TaxID=4460 RepID=A0A843X7Z1_COLES|nr:hypothetical protein [Colocasia esculenta]